MQRTEHQILRRKRYGASDGAAVGNESYVNRPVDPRRLSVFSCPINGVYDPDPIGGEPIETISSLFGQEGIPGALGGQTLGDEAMGGSVAGVFHRPVMSLVIHQPLAQLEQDFPGIGRQLGR